MRPVFPRTTPRVLVVKNRIYDKIDEKNIPDLWRRSRTHEYHSFQIRKNTQIHKIQKYQQNSKMTEKLTS